MFWAICSVAIVRVNDGFSIAIGIKGVAEFLELFAQLAIVVDLAIENDPRGAILIVNRLPAAREIDNRQPAHPQAHGPAEIEAVFVRTAMANCVAHPADQMLVNVATIVSNYACDSTHNVSLGTRERSRTLGTSSALA